MSEFELVEIIYLTRQQISTLFTEASSVTFLYILVAHFAGKNLPTTIAIGLTSLYTLFLLGPLGAYVAINFEQQATSLEILDKYPDNILALGVLPTWGILILGLGPYLLAWAGSIFYMHRHIRRDNA